MGKELLGFLELSGVGRVMDDGVDEEEARAGRLDRWIPLQTEEWVVPRAPSLNTFSLLSFLWSVFVQGDSYSECCAHTVEGGGFVV
jgi:hypothetical protein